MDRTQAFTALICLLLAGCGSTGPSVRVGSKNFTEQVLLGEIIAQQLEGRADVAVERKLNLGGTMLAHQALLSGGIDLYPEYTGTALTAILKLPAASDPASVFETVKREYGTRFNLDVLRPLGFNNTFAMVVRADVPILSLSEAQARSRQWRLGVGYEFVSRPDGLPALNRSYRLQWEGSPRTMDLGLLYKALEADQVDMIAANSTDGLLSTLPVKALRDDLGAFPPYEAVVVIRPAVLRVDQRIRPALDELSGKLTSTTMQRLNYEVDGKKRPAADVAREFLKTLR